MPRWVPAASACAWFLSSFLASSTVANAASDASFAVSSDYLQGIEALDAGRLADAIVSLKKVVAAEPEFPGARMELARAQFHSGDYQSAENEFRILLAQAPPERARSIIQRYLDAIPGRALFATSRWSGAAQFGAGYDSNANGSTNDQMFLGFTLNPRNVETASAFGELALSGANTMSLTPSVALITTAQLTHRANPDASFVDQSIASLATAVAWSRGDYRFSAGVDGYLGWLDRDSHEHGVNLNGAAARAFGPYDAALSVRVGEVNYVDDGLGLLEVNRYLAGVSVSRPNLLGYPLRAGIALLGGKDDAKKSGSPYGNDRYGARVFGSWQLRADSAVYAELSNMSTDYDGDFFASHRRDRQFALTLSLDRQDFPAAGWNVAPRIRYLKNDSNISLYEYDRLEAMVFIRRSFLPRPVRSASAPLRLASNDSQVGSDVGRSAVQPTAETAVAPLAVNGAFLNVWRKPEQAIEVVSPLGMRLDVTNPHLPGRPRVTTAISVPGSGFVAFASSTTELRQALEFDGGGSLLQFSDSFGGAPSATYLADNSAAVDFGSNGASGIRWGRWTNGSASIYTRDGAETLDLRRASLHWIAGPTFEATPVVPVSGFINFTLAGGTSPTDNLGRVGVLSGGTLTADFTKQEVRTQLSLDIGSYNWFATGKGTLAPGSVQFGGSFGTVLVDGRVAGTGEFKGFLSTGALTPDQINGAGMSYWLDSSATELGTVSGTAAFVPAGIQPMSPVLVQADVAYSTGFLSNADIVGGTASNSRSELLTDSQGYVRQFGAPVPSSTNGILGIGFASNTNAGADEATGIRWGRWTGGALDITTPPRGAVSSDFTSKSLHWIAGNEFGGPPVLAQTGTANYTLVGNTDPTDTRGHVGTLGSAALSANFTTRTVTSEITLNIGGFDWYAKGSGTYQVGAHNFVGSYDDVRIQNLARGRGMMYGFFTQPRPLSGSEPGAGMSFSLADNFGQLGVVSGVLAFVESDNTAVVAPPAQKDRDIAYVSPDFTANETFVSRVASDEYALGPDFNLVSFQGRANTTPADPARYALGTGAIIGSGVAPAVMLRWGRWSDGDVEVLNITSSSTYSVDTSQSSVHWIQSADTSAPPTMPVFGSASYEMVGGTLPTDRAGNTGVLRNATMSANFTTQSVSTSFDIAINAMNIVATGEGRIGADAGLSPHQFAGDINGGTVSTSATTPQGTFSGFFTAPGGSTAAVPGGAGLTYSIKVDQTIVDGAVALGP